MHNVDVDMGNRPVIVWLEWVRGSHTRVQSEPIRSSSSAGISWDGALEEQQKVVTDATLYFNASKQRYREKPSTLHVVASPQQVSSHKHQDL